MVKSYLFFLSLLIFSSGVKGQVSWHVKEHGAWNSTDSTSDSVACFTSVSCFGNTCVAAATIQTNSASDPKHITFYYSLDGGVTWKERLPDIEIPSITTNYGITKIQQIDSLHIVAIGDFGLIVTSSDGGITWKRRDCPVAREVLDIHFSDPMTGILTVAGADSMIFITSDGGQIWQHISFRGSNLYSCHSDGGGKFRIFNYGHGPIYSTNNNFQTVDSTEPIFSYLSDPQEDYLFMRCAFSNDETVLLSGVYYAPDVHNAFGGDGLIMRSIDGGKHWEHPFIFPIDKISQIHLMSSLDRDTIIADGHCNYNFAISTDRGSSWHTDTIRILDTAYLPYACFGLAMTGDNHLISSFSFINIPLQSLLLRGEFSQSNVEYIERIIYHTKIYPNPASDLVTISSIDVSKPIHIIDIFGNEVMHGMLSDQGLLTLDISKLAHGVYDILIDHYDKRFAIGKIAVIGK